MDEVEVDTNVVDERNTLTRETIGQLIVSFVHSSEERSCSDLRTSEGNTGEGLIEGAVGRRFCVSLNRDGDLILRFKVGTEQALRGLVPCVRRHVVELGRKRVGTCEEAYYQ